MTLTLLHGWTTLERQDGKCGYLFFTTRKEWCVCGLCCLKHELAQNIE